MQDKVEPGVTRKNLEDLLENPETEVIVLGENHHDNAARELLINNVDLLQDKDLTQQREVIVLMEHLPEKTALDLQEEGKFSSEKIDREEIDIQKTVQESLERKALAPSLEHLILTMTMYPDANKEYANVAKVLIKNGVRIGGAENEFSGNSSFASNFLVRIKNGDRAFTESVSRRYVEAENKSEKKPIIILVCGTEHSFGVKALLANKGIHAYAWSIFSADKNKEPSDKTDCSITSLPPTGPNIVEYIQNNYRTSLDRVNYIDRETESDYAFFGASVRERLKAMGEDPSKLRKSFSVFSEVFKNEDYENYKDFDKDADPEAESKTRFGPKSTY